jgi:hypothetical protein
MKPSAIKIERFIEREEARLGIHKVVPPRWVRVLVDDQTKPGETTQSAIDRHLREHPEDAGCNWIADVILTPEPRTR